MVPGNKLAARRLEAASTIFPEVVHQHVDGARNRRGL